MSIVAKLEGLVESANSAAEIIGNFPGNIRVISHYDADGIASASIIVKALERARKNFRLSFVKQLSEEYIKGLAGDPELLFIFCDLGSGFLGEISKNLFDRKRKIIILDHHDPQGTLDGNIKGEVYHVNPVLFGIRENISGSGVSYLMARALDPINKDLSEMAIIGAIGDSQIGSIGPHWGLLGINKEILKDSQSTGKIRLDKGLRLWGRYGRPLHKALQYSVDPYIPDVSGSESGSIQLLKESGIDLKKDTGEWKTLSDLSEEETRRLATGIIKQRIGSGEDNPEWIFGDVYELMEKKESNRDANEFATMLNACGKSGNGWLGIGLCLNDEETSGDVKKVMSKHRREIGKAVDLVRKNPDIVRVTENAEYVFAGGRINEHVIGNVASILEKSCLVGNGSCRRPLFAMARDEDGNIKVSGRASDGWVEKGFSIKKIMESASKEIGGQGGGHAGAGGATIPKGSEEKFFGFAEEYLGKIKPNGNIPEKEKEPEHEENPSIGKEIISGDTEKKGEELKSRERDEAIKMVISERKKEIEQKAEEEKPKVSKEMEKQGLVKYLFS